MPRGKKSKARAREKRRQAHVEAQELKAAQATAAEKGESPSCSDQASGDAAPSASTAGLPEKSQGKAPTSTAGGDAALKRSGKGAKGQKEESSTCCRVLHYTESPQNDLLSRKTGILMHYLLCRYKMKEPMKKGEMLKVINRRYKEHFPEILRKASERIQLVFGLEVKEVKPNGNFYTLVSKLDPGSDTALTTGLPFPQNGLLMPLLGIIFLNGNRASENEIWEFLNILGIFDGKMHIILGMSELITRDLVQENYLEYRLRVNSDPPCFEFLWGPRAYAETSKMKVLEFLAKVNETVPRAFPSHFEEALRDEEERTKAEEDIAAKAKEDSKVTPGDSSCA